MISMNEEIWNKIKTLYVDLGIKPVMFRQWKHVGYVPPKWHWPLCEAAKKRKIKLKMEDFVSSPTQEAAQ